MYFIPISKLFNKCIKQEIFQRGFRAAYVISIPKTSSLKSLNEFRLISLLSIFSKLFEQILKNKMLVFIDKYNMLTLLQFGFKANTSFYDNLLNNINERETTCSIFLDLRKTFDSVNHSILLKKLYHYGFRGKIFNFLTLYLTDCQICSKTGSTVSSPQIVNQGVSQGSVLGPLLFLLYVNDLPHASKFDTTLFADDTNLHFSLCNINILQSQVN